MRCIIARGSGVMYAQNLIFLDLSNQTALDHVTGTDKQGYK